MTRAEAERALRTATLALGRRDPALRSVIKAVGPCTLRPHRRYFAALVHAIVNQQLSGRAAATILRRVLSLYPTRRHPTAAEMLATPPALLRSAGLSRAKVDYLRDLCRQVEDGRLPLRRLSRLDDGEIVTALVAVKGVGEWTAQMFLMFSLCRLDVLPTGDLGVRKGMQRVYGLPHLPTPSEMHAVAAARGWSPYRSVASWYMWQALTLPGAPSSLTI